MNERAWVVLVVRGLALWAAIKSVDFWVLVGTFLSATEQTRRYVPSRSGSHFWEVTFPQLIGPLLGATLLLGFAIYAFFFGGLLVDQIERGMAGKSKKRYW